VEQKADQPAPKSAGRPGRSNLLDLPNIILTAAVVIAVALLVSSSRNNSSLAAENAALRQQLAELSTIRVGDVVPPIRTSSPGGSRDDIVYDGSRKRLLFIFSTTCRVCDGQVPAWNRLARELKAQGVASHGVSLDGPEATESYFKGKERDFDVVTPDESVLRSYRVTAVPQVVLVSGDGSVSWLHTGALTEERVQELLSQGSARR